jgi:sugar lactone lactonase YvrE
VKRAVSRLGKSLRPTTALLFATLLSAFFVTSVMAIIGNQTADREIGQIDVSHNMPNFGGPAALAQGLGAVAIDNSSMVHHVYVADAENNRVLGWNDVTKLANGAPADLVLGQPDFYTAGCNDGPFFGDDNGLGADSLCQPVSVTVDGSGNLYVADVSNNRVLEYNTPFATCAGIFPCVGASANLVFGQAVGSNFTSTSCTVTQAGLCAPGGVAADASGNLYIADSANNRVLEFTGPFGPGQANDVTAHLVFGQGSFTAKTCAQSQTGLCHPEGLALDASGDLYVADSSNNRVLEYDDPLGAGPTDDVSADLVFGQGSPGNFTTKACASSAIALCRPTSVALDTIGNLYVADGNNNRAVEYDGPFGAGQSNVTANRVYGQGNLTSNACANGIASNPAPSATGMCDPTGIALDGGNLYLSDANNARVLIFDTALTNSTANLELGQSDLTHNMTNFGGAMGVAAPGAVAVDRVSSPNHLYVADTNNNRVLGYRSVIAFRNGAPADIILGQPDFFAKLQNGSLNSPGATTLNGPLGLALDQSHHLAVADTINNRVLLFPDPFGYSGSTPEPATVVLGQGASGTNFTANACSSTPGANDLCLPEALSFDANGNLFVADAQNNRVLEYNIPLVNPLSPNVTANLVFGQGGSFSAHACGDGIGQDPAPSATTLCRPDGVTLDGTGNLYVSDGINRVLEYNGPFGSGQANELTADLVFGKGATGNSFTTSQCDDGNGAHPPPSTTGMCNPGASAISPAGDLYVTDQQNNRLLKFNGPFGSGKTNDVTADVVFGQGPSGTNFAGSVCAGGSASAPGTAGASGLCFPDGVDLDAAGDLFIADADNNRVVVYDVSASPTPTATPTVTPTSTGSATPSATSTSTSGATKTATPTITATATSTASASASPTFTPSATATSSANPTAISTSTSTSTSTPTQTPTDTATATATPAPTITPVAGTLKVIPRSLGFGTVLVGNSRTRDVTIRNAGKHTKKVQAPSITLESVVTANPFQVTANDCPAMLPAGQHCTVSITFTPGMAIPAGTSMAFAGTLTIDDNVLGDLENSVALKGTGKAPKK